LARGPAPCLYHLLLCRRVYRMAKALNSAQYCHWRGGPLAAPRPFFGGGDPAPLPRALSAFPPHLLLRSPPFFGALAPSRRGLRPRLRSHAPGRCWGRGNAAADYALFHGARAYRCVALVFRVCPVSLWSDRDRSRHADGHVRVACP